MESSEDKHWAHRALIDPLNEPEPFAEDGPGSSFRIDTTTTTPINRNRSSSTSTKLQKGNSLRKPSSAKRNNPFVSEKEISRQDSAAKAYPSPPQSASPRQDRFSPRQQAFGAYNDASPMPPPKDGAHTSILPLRRGHSLKERYPGDRSHRPLDAIKQERRAADRAPHLRKQHQILPDPVDKLDSLGSYHHEGPFDATYYARNTSYVNSPVEALAASNEEAIKATPRDRIIDSVHHHRPLDGVATYAPGEIDHNGQVYDYEPGENMMIHGNPEGGAYKRWPGMQYHDDDIKGKGEPSYTIEKSLKNSDTRRRAQSDVHRGGIEMSTRARHATSEKPGRYEEFGDGPGQVPMMTPENSIRRSNTTGRNSKENKLSRGSNGEGTLRKRFGSIRRSLGGHEDKES